MGDLLTVLTVTAYAVVLAWFASVSVPQLVDVVSRMNTGRLWWMAVASVLALAAGVAWAQAGGPPPGAPAPHPEAASDLYAMRLIVEGGAALAGSVLASLGLTRRVEWLERSLHAMHARLTAFGVPEHPPSPPPSQPPRSPGQ